MWAGLGREIAVPRVQQPVPEPVSGAEPPEMESLTTIEFFSAQRQIPHHRIRAMWKDEKAPRCIWHDSVGHWFEQHRLRAYFKE